jgi:hypothetical protein
MYFADQPIIRAFDQRPSFGIDRLFEKLKKGAERKEFSFKSPKNPMVSSKILLELLRAFGLFEYTLNDDSRWNNSFYVAITTLTLTENGQKILPILFSQRPTYLWGGQDPYMTRSRIELIYGPIDPKKALPLELTDLSSAWHRLEIWRYAQRRAGPLRSLVRR